MAERKGGVWVGGAVTWRGSVINASAEALAATGDAEGKRVRLELNRQFQAGAVTVTPRHTVFVDLSATGLGSAIKDSPLVDRSNQAGIKAGYLYSF